MNVYMVNSGYEGCGYVRIMLPAFHNGFKANKTSLDSGIDNPKKTQEMMRSADVVVFHRPERKEFYDMAMLLKKDGKKIVMDNDDTFLIDDHYVMAGLNYDGTQLELDRRQKAIESFMSISDLVTTSTEILAEEYRKKHNNVVVLPNCVDEMDWEKPKRNEGDKIRIGLVGSVAYEYDYLHLKDVLKELRKRDDVQLVLFGLGDKKHRDENPNVTRAFKEEYEFWDGLDVEQIPWCKVSDYPTQLNNAKLDIMLIPRKNNYFNRCKSNIKYLEASMCEIPVIAQSFAYGPYEEILHGTTGLLVKDNNDWMKHINYLINNKDARRIIGAKAKDYTLSKYNIDDHASKWMDAYKAIYEKTN